MEEMWQGCVVCLDMGMNGVNLREVVLMKGVNFVKPEEGVCRWCECWKVNSE